MKWSLMTKTLALLVGGLAWPALAPGAVDLALLEKGRVHQSTDVGGRFEFPLGPVVYQAEADDTYSKGYRPATSRQLEGDLTREVYDLPVQMRSRGGFALVRESLESSGFDIIFECAREACGKPQAWALYLSPLMRGDSEAQYYLAAQAGHESFVAVYAKELGGQARILLDHILTDQGESEAARDTLISFKFAKGSAALPAQTRKQLSSLANRINTAPAQERFLLIGHADQAGSLLRNLMLSGKRARALHDTLVNQYGIGAERLDIAAHGYLRPQSSGGRADRRVDVLMQPVASEPALQEKLSAAVRE